MAASNKGDMMRDFFLTFFFSFWKHVKHVEASYTFSGVQYMLRKVACTVNPCRQKEFY